MEEGTLKEPRLVALLFKLLSFVSLAKFNGQCSDFAIQVILELECTCEADAVLHLKLAPYLARITPYGCIAMSLEVNKDSIERRCCRTHDGQVTNPDKWELKWSIY